MPTLLLRLAAPLQSWGSCSKFETRTTENMPTKSGVVGMLASALGISRDADPKELKRLVGLKFGVRADRAGENMMDYHIAQGKDTYVTKRYYLSDAVFLAGLEGDEELLKELSDALQNPVYPLYLGRRSCPPTLPLVIGIRETALETALREEPSLEKLCEGLSRRNRGDRFMRIQIETDCCDAGIVQDVPRSFDQRKRVYGYRRVKEFFIELDKVETEHDALSELE